MVWEDGGTTGTAAHKLSHGNDSTARASSATDFRVSVYWRDKGGQEVCTDRRYGSSTQKLVVAVSEVAHFSVRRSSHADELLPVYLGRCSREQMTANQFNKALP